MKRKKKIVSSFPPIFKDRSIVDLQCYGSFKYTAK